MLFDVKHGTSYDVGPMGFTLNDVERLKVKVTSIDSKYLENDE